jgi:DNA helicase TIP49 (TBP-interacting protein)
MCFVICGSNLCSPHSTKGFLALFTGDTGEIAAEVRAQIDTKVRVLCFNRIT